MNELFYLERISQGYKRNPHSAKNKPKDWWIIKPDGLKGRIQLHTIVFPKKMIGKRVRIHIEVLNV